MAECGGSMTCSCTAAAHGAYTWTEPRPSVRITHHNHRLGCVYDCVKPSLPLSCPDTELYGGFPPPPYICVFITTDFSTRLALD